MSAKRLSSLLILGPDGLSPVLGGQLLLAGAGVTVAVGAALLRPDVVGWSALGVISVVMVLALVGSRPVPWDRLSPSATLCFPILVCGGLVALSQTAATVAAPLTGVLVLCATYVGLVHRSGTIVVLLPVLGAAYVSANDGLTRITSVRLIIAAVIWTLLAELLSLLTAQQRRLSQALRSAAQTDVLTGVGNRREIDLRLAVCQPGDVVVICDLDHFKTLNDIHGHLLGDRVLADFGAMLRAELRDGDFAGRFGGEEFMLLLQDTTVPAATVLLTRLHRSWGLLHPGVTFSAGLAACTSGRDVEDAVAVADRSLYLAKSHGRDCDRSEHDLDTALRASE